VFLNSHLPLILAQIELTPIYWGHLKTEFEHLSLSVAETQSSIIYHSKQRRQAASVASPKGHVSVAAFFVREENASR
jgi:hypothetical protein